MIVLRALRRGRSLESRIQPMLRDLAHGTRGKPRRAILSRRSGRESQRHRRRDEPAATGTIDEPAAESLHGIRVAYSVEQSLRSIPLHVRQREGQEMKEKFKR